jgi:hypothetical protein
MCENCAGGSGIEQQIAYLERVIKDQERLKAGSMKTTDHDRVIQKAREALEGLRRSLTESH